MYILHSDHMVLFDHGVIEYLSHTFQVKEHFDKILATLSLPPLFTTIRVPKDDESNDAARQLLSENLLKQSENRGWNPFQQFVHPALKDCIIVENRGPNKLEMHAKEIVVDVHCGMAVLRGADVFKLGILGAPHGLKKGDQVSVFADLNGKCLKGLASLYNGAKIHVGNGISQVARSDLFNANSSSPSGVGILITDPLYQAPSLADLNPTLLFPQNLPSIMCTHVLDPQPGEIVLDLCAAPGGKTTHVASRMDNKGRVVALEKSGERAARMKEMIEKIHCPIIIETYAFDSIKAVDPDAVLDGGPPYPPGKFDRILVDAPCSALGQRPCLANRMPLSQIKSFPAVQHKLLCAAVQLLKAGGVLVYSTCTLQVEENEDQVHRILKKFPSLTLVPIPFKMGTKGLASSQLSDLDRSLVMRFDPSSATNPNLAAHPWDSDTIGFFLAKFQKVTCDS